MTERRLDRWRKRHRDLCARSAVRAWERACRHARAGNVRLAFYALEAAGQYLDTARELERARLGRIVG
jgi:hypothetical protein